MKYTCLIADDNLLERDALEMHLKKIDRLQIVASCADGLEAAKVLGEQQVDIVFSDIDMPDMSGFGLLKSLRQAPVFIFISAHPEYAVESFALDVVDFMVKPVTLERIMKAANKAIEYIELKKLAASKQTAPEPANKNAGDDHFFIKGSNGLEKVMYDEVTYIESMGDFSKIFTTSDKKHVTLVSLKQLESQLPEDTFMRIHKQHIVNYHQITAISANDLTVHNTYTVPLGSSYKQQLMDKVVDKKIISRF
jgi:two-component system LytT family response regulator